ncbi:hypothetical protein [Limnothrix redekei]|uniref:Uncharacterized protein n=1 Tax=Limnothrix redekei LRLZ20PSL1 TaxID=3112953 RepID=A0ABW7C8P8_9CYAN
MVMVAILRSYQEQPDPWIGLEAQGKRFPDKRLEKLKCFGSGSFQGFSLRWFRILAALPEREKVSIDPDCPQLGETANRG